MRFAQYLIADECQFDVQHFLLSSLYSDKELTHCWWDCWYCCGKCGGWSLAVYVVILLLVSTVHDCIVMVMLLHYPINKTFYKIFAVVDIEVKKRHPSPAKWSHCQVNLHQILLRKKTPNCNCMYICNVRIISCVTPCLFTSHDILTRRYSYRHCYSWQHTHII